MAPSSSLLQSLRFGPAPSNLLSLTEYEPSVFCFNRPSARSLTARVSSSAASNACLTLSTNVRAAASSASEWHDMQPLRLIRSLVPDMYAIANEWPPTIAPPGRGATLEFLTPLYHTLFSFF